LLRPLADLFRLGGVVMLAVAIGGCGGGAVDVDPTSPDPQVAAQCNALLNELPDTVDGQDRREIKPDDALAVAWGDPAIVLRCGVPKPAALTPISSCFVVNDIGWLATVDGREYTQSGPPDDTMVFTTIGRSAYVEVSVPAHWSPQADALTEVSSAIAAATQDVQPCQ
jgi:hypothetical protein